MNTLLHWAFDAMVARSPCADRAGGPAWHLLVAQARHPEDQMVPARHGRLRAAAIVALECGWIVTEVGRQPWIVYEVMRTKDAVTDANGVWVSLAVVLVLYAALGHARSSSFARWRDAGVRPTRWTRPMGRASVLESCLRR